MMISKGNMPNVGEQIISGRHLRDKSFDGSLRKTESFLDSKSLHGYKGFSSKKFDTKSKLAKSSSKAD